MGRIATMGLSALLTLLVVMPARADLGLPDYVRLPPQIVLDPDQALLREDFGQAEFSTDAAGATKEEKRGRHFARWFAYKPATGEPAPGYDNGTEARIHAALQGSLAKTGWQNVFTSEDKSQFSLRLMRDGKEIWAAIRMDGPQAQVFIEIVEVGSAAPTLKLSPPATKPEKVSDKQDLPYLPPWPGSKRTGEGRADGPLDVGEPGKGEEPRLVGQGVVIRSYQGPATLSRLQFVSDYREALLAAGWSVVYPVTPEAVVDHASLVAHYARDGRDIWVKLFYEFTASLSYSVVDLGGEDWSAALARDCRLPLYGVFFDFNKAALKPESDPVLTKVAALLKAQGAAKAEIQGHTDAIGGDDYNLMLSDARAASVRTWLTQHGVAAERIASKGYGKSQPVADNGSDEGRARNRRVELVRLGCTRK